MSDHTHTPPLLVIVGQTATGKSDLAVALAQRFDGEIICADSRTVYSGLDIGTAKPTLSDRRQVPHHGLDLVQPDQQFTVADFKTYTEAAIASIASRGKLPIIVGGSGLYVDAVLYDYQFGLPADPAVRDDLSTLSVPELQDLIAARGLDLPANSMNPRHLMRTIETNGARATRSPIRQNTCIMGLRADSDILRQRIVSRVDAMVDNGLVDEVIRISQAYGWDCSALQAPGYKAFRQYLAGDVSLDQAKADFVHNDMQLAKRQLTWFKRNKSIHWLSDEDVLAEAVDIATTFLNK